jgi:hypothetical protein
MILLFFLENWETELMPPSPILRFRRKIEFDGLQPTGSQARLQPTGSQARLQTSGSQARLQPTGLQARLQPTGSQARLQPTGAQKNADTNGAGVSVDSVESLGALSKPRLNGSESSRRRSCLEAKADAVSWLSGLCAPVEEPQIRVVAIFNFYSQPVNCPRLWKLLV